MATGLTKNKSGYLADERGFTFNLPVGLRDHRPPEPYCHTERMGWDTAAHALILRQQMTPGA